MPHSRIVKQHNGNHPFNEEKFRAMIRFLEEKCKGNIQSRDELIKKLFKLKKVKMMRDQKYKIILEDILFDPNCSSVLEEILRDLEYTSVFDKILSDPAYTSTKDKILSNSRYNSIKNVMLRNESGTSGSLAASISISSFAVGPSSSVTLTVAGASPFAASVAPTNSPSDDPRPSHSIAVPSPLQNADPLQHFSTERIFASLYARYARSGSATQPATNPTASTNPQSLFFSQPPQTQHTAYSNSGLLQLAAPVSYSHSSVSSLPFVQQRVPEVFPAYFQYVHLF